MDGPRLAAVGAPTAAPIRPRVRIYALVASGLAVAEATAALTVSVVSRSPGCPPGYSEFFDPRAALIDAGAVAVALSVAVLAACVPRRSHRVAAVLATLAAPVALYLFTQALSLHAGDLNSCLTF